MSEAASLGFGQYAHNNQPVHHVLYVAALGGCRAFAQKTLRRVMKAAYTQDGWSGDEDTGEMSSWYVLSSLGLYSLVPGSDDLVLGSPEVKRARLVVPGRPELEIQAPENSEDHVYVQGVQLNGKALEAAVPYSLLAKSGGRLEFTMSTAPTDSL
ncbi:unnamed protein product [Effrenium voratum]|nr:unnamed protein product [Effrenium voratum]